MLEPNDGCLRMARSLGARGVSVQALASQPNAFVCRSRAVEGRRMPGLPEGREEWLRELERLAEGGDGLLISGSDAATELIAGERGRIPAQLRSFEGADGIHLAVMNKARLYQLALEAGARVPWVKPLKTVDELERVAAEVAYPCILKPTLSHLGRKLRDLRTTLVRDEDELSSSAGPALEDGLEMLVTEYVPGPERNLEGAVTVRRPDGSMSLCYGRRKVRSHPPDFGVGSLHCSAHVPETIEMARRVLDAANFVGVSILEAKCHAETGERVLIEVNVRVPQGFGLGDACGVDASWRLYATLAGLPVGPQPPPRYGVKAVLPFFDVLTVGGRLRSGELSARQLLRSYRGTREVGVLDPRDPGPGLALAGRAVRQAAARRRGQLGTRRRQAKAAASG